MLIDGAINCVYDIYSATDEEFSFLFPKNTDIAFIDEVLSSHTPDEVANIFEGLHSRPMLAKPNAMGLHGILFYELEEKKQYYPTRLDREAINPDGSRLRPNPPPPKA